MDSFRETGGLIRVLIVCCEYNYIPKYRLTSFRDGQNFKRMAVKAGVEDITFMRDDYPPEHPLFPTAKHMIAQIQEIGKRSDHDDYFVFFFAGHADTIAPNVIKRVFPDLKLTPEEDGKDECFQLPGPNREFDWEFFLIDDEFSRVVDEAFVEEVRVLVITDCCHSGTIADIDTHDWGQRRVCSFAACRDWEESTDTGRGGVLSKAIEYAVRELAVTKGKKEYSLDSIWKKVVKYCKRLEKDQEPMMSYRNLRPGTAPWPLPHHWWKNPPGTITFKLGLEIEELRKSASGKGGDCEAGVRAVKAWDAAKDEEFALHEEHASYGAMPQAAPQANLLRASSSDVVAPMPLMQSYGQGVRMVAAPQGAGHQLVTMPREFLPSPSVGMLAPAAMLSPPVGTWSTKSGMLAIAHPVGSWAHPASMSRIAVSRPDRSDQATLRS